MWILVTTYFGVGICKQLVSFFQITTNLTIVKCITSSNRGLPFSLSVSRTKNREDQMKVLVADDSGVMRKIIVRALNGCGMTDIVEAKDGKEGWNLFQAEQIDCVLTDWNMPEMNGLELLKAIRGSGSEVPVIMITTEGEKAKVLEAIHAGVTDYLCKPFEQEDLMAKLDKYAPA